MALAYFRNNSYDYCKKDNDVLFSQDRADEHPGEKIHGHLFDYVSKDVSGLQALLEQHISKKMNTETFELTGGYVGEENVAAEIKKILIPLHPYYEHEYRIVIIKAIGDYFNALLVFRHHFKAKEKWYLKRFEALAGISLEYGDEHPRDFYNKYWEWVAGADVIENVPDKMPKGFSNEIGTQENIRKMLFWILDVSAPVLDGLDTHQRMWLYGIMFMMPHGLSKLDVTKHLYFRPDNNDYGVDRDSLIKIGDLCRPLYAAISGCQTDRAKIPRGMLDALNKAVEYAKMALGSEVYEEYEIDNLYQLLYLEILSMIQTDTIIKMCKRCGMYFVVKDRKKAYCERIIKGKVCSAVGPKLSFQEKVEENIPYKKYQRAYKTHHARVMKRTMSNPDFYAWCDEAQKKLGQIKASEPDESDEVAYAAWLNNDVAAFETWLKK